MEVTENQSFTTRLFDFIKSKNLSVRQFEIDCGLKGSLIHSAIKNKATIGTDKVMKISKIFPELNIDWLITGNGYMLHGGEKTLPPNFISMDGEQNVTILHVKALAGSSTASYSREDVAGQMYIPMLKGNYVAIMVNGESMEPKLRDGSYIVVNQASEVHDGKVYVVVTQDNNVYVKLVRKKADQFTLISVNKEYEDIILNSDEIICLYEVIMTITGQ